MRGYRDNHIKEDTMRNKRLLAISAIAISASVFMTACSFGGDGKTDKTETVEVTDTPTPEVTQAPTETPVPTIAPNVQSTTYTSADKSIAINLPDATWANKTDETDMLSFESPEQGNILILHGQGEDTMAATVVPSTQDMAVSLEQADGDKVNGTDFEIQEYSANDVNGIGVYSYTTKMLNTDKSNGNLYVVHKVFANDTEYYTIDAGVKTEDALASVKAAVESFQILGDSTLKEAAPQQAPVENTAQTDANTSDAAAQPAADANTGDAAANGSTDAAATDGTANAAATDNSDSSGTATNSGGFTEEQLTNTDETRTLYRNSDGHPFVITPDGNGNWVDSDGNVYNFIDEQDAYDAEGNSYYWHGEAADVYYMPVQ
ncbi:hypothetical protein GT671_12690 [Blautia obeum]|jgi:hypothetical protein|uniref:Uncharacterized protein n=2 Tax=Blautia obeum TaxID=40520 RepID=A0A396A173_9FIRM|nr:hypothetical protein [Blautia obeum]NSG04784.1 hypothetical protein [Blautia obeum]NSG26150.1 hypothetical protein [Blautia obeum]RGN87186.1 hypothetical protein DXB38_09840 [Blautia obeum]RGQ06381.1 hypothetical protein DWZ12_04120 [Blautia obeum]